MPKLKRENRYVVIKIKHLDGPAKDLLARLLEANSIPVLGKDCVVIEDDWPEYEQAWKAIESRMSGSGESTQPGIDALKAQVNALRDHMADIGSRGWTDKADRLLSEIPGQSLSKHDAEVRKQHAEFIIKKSLDTHGVVLYGQREAAEWLLSMGDEDGK